MRHEQQLGLGPPEVAEGLPMAEDPGLVALVELLAPAEEALPAGGPVGAEHPVADRHPGHLVTGRYDLADELVADHEAGLDLDPPVIDVEIRAADAARLDADDRVVRRQHLRLGDVIDLYLAGRLEGDRAHS